MPLQGFGQGYLQGQSVANDRQKIQMAAEAQERLFAARDAVNTANKDLEEFRQQTAQVVDGLQQELDNNRADFQMLKLERAASSMLGGNLSDIKDTFNNQDLRELYLNDNGIKDFFGNTSGLSAVRTYNPNDEEERRAYERYIKDKYGEGADTSDTKALSDKDVYTYQMADGTVQVYDRTAVARALGLGAESSSIRQMIEDQDKIDEDLMKKEGVIRQEVSDEELKKRESALTAAQQKLAAEDSSYKAPGAGSKDPFEAAKQYAGAVKDLVSGGATLESAVKGISAITGIPFTTDMFKEAGLSPKEESELATAALARATQQLEIGDSPVNVALDYFESTGKVLNLAGLTNKAEQNYQLNEAELNKSQAATAKLYADIAKAGTPDAEEAIYLKAAMDGGYEGDQAKLAAQGLKDGSFILAPDKDGKIVAIPKPKQEFSTQAGVKQAEEAISGFEAELEGTEFNWDNFDKWTPELKRKAAHAENIYAENLKHGKRLSEREERELTTIAKRYSLQSRFLAIANEDTRGIDDDIRNTVFSYFDDASGEVEVRANKLNEFAALLVATSFNDRTSKVLIDEVKRIYGADFGKGFSGVLQSTIDALQTDRVALESMLDNSGNSIERARIQGRINAIDNGISFAKNKFNIEVNTGINTTEDNSDKVEKGNI